MNKQEISKLFDEHFSDFNEKLEVKTNSLKRNTEMRVAELDDFKQFIFGTVIPETRKSIIDEIFALFNKEKEKYDDSWDYWEDVEELKELIKNNIDL
jgi:hypothetical protein